MQHVHTGARHALSRDAIASVSLLPPLLDRASAGGRCGDGHSVLLFVRGGGGGAGCSVCDGALGWVERGGGRNGAGGR